MSFSAPKGVERACPVGCLYTRQQRLVKVSVPRRALRGHAPRGEARAMVLVVWFQCPEGR